MLASTLSFVASPETPSFLAYAATECEDDDNCDEKTLEEAMGDKYSPNQEGFEELMAELEKSEKDGGPPEESILYAFKRHFTVGYMNEGDDAVIASNDEDDNPLAWYSTIFNDRNKYNCGQGYGLREGQSRYYPGEENGELFWHNCDVPNLITEFLQDVTLLFFEPGMSGAEVDSSYTRTPWLGFSSNTPETVKQDSRANVTALEVFGYNLNYTSYRGEWDHIKVMTAARALSNFGFLDKLKLGTQAILNGILGGVNSAVNGLVDDLKSGNIVRIITSPLRFIGNFFGGGISSTVDTVIDTSDTNVFATMAWYRPGFGSTLYNARALSQDEIVDYIQAQLVTYLQKIEKEREKATPPADLLAIKPDTLRALDPPSPGLCRASGTYSVNGGAPIPVNWDFPAETADAGTCEAAVNLRRRAILADNGGNVSFNITVTSNPRKTVAQWSTEAGWEAVVEKYQIYCTLEGSDSTSPTAVNTFLTCLENDQVGYPAAVARETLNEQSKLDLDWFSKFTEQQEISAFFRAQAESFTSPNAKYICLNPDGTDMVRGGEFVRLVLGTKENQRFNPECEPVRKPIQNALFGNGYLDGQPPVDTRREVYGFSLWDFIAGDEVWASAGLTISKATTRLSNAVLNLAFAPILQTLSLDVILTNLIIGFRDGLFFPLALLVMVVGALSVFFQAGVKRDYGAQAKSLLLMVGVFFLGTILMTDPARTITFVDEAPAQLEAVVTGSIFEVGKTDTDNLCNATTATNSTVGSEDFAGNTIRFDPAAASRNMLCENWRVFAFGPYVYGQWGTSYDNLNYENFHAEGDQAILVGNGQGEVAPYVPLGGNGANAERNWGLYQLDVLTAGTSTTYDPRHSQTNDANIYRLVDLQAGPGGQLENAPYDATHFEMWRGDKPMGRIMVAWLGAATSIVGMLTIILFAFAKIQISLMSMLMLLFMPFMFLIGLMPGQGRFKLKGYFMQLISLMVQRVVLVAMLALMLRVITSIAQASDNFFYYSVLTIATCLVFLTNRKEILGLFDKNIAGKSGGFGKGGSAMEFLPRSLQQKADTVGNMARAGAYAAVGGFMAGGVSGIKPAVKGATDRQRSSLSLKHSRQGLGAFNVASKARTDARNAVEGSLNEYLDTDLKPIATARVSDRVGQDVGDEAVHKPAEQKAVEQELEKMRPKSAGDFRRVSRRRKAEKALYSRDERSAQDVREDLRRATTQDGLAALDGVQAHVDDLKPKLTEDPEALRAYREASEDVALDIGLNLRASELKESRKERVVNRVSDALTPTSTDPIDRVVEEGQERAEQRAVNKAVITESAKEVMKQFKTASFDKLSSPEDRNE